MSNLANWLTSLQKTNELFEAYGVPYEDQDELIAEVNKRKSTEKAEKYLKEKYPELYQEAIERRLRRLDRTQSLVIVT